MKIYIIFKIDYHEEYLLNKAYTSLDAAKESLSECKDKEWTEYYGYSLCILSGKHADGRPNWAGYRIEDLNMIGLEDSHVPF